MSISDATTEKRVPAQGEKVPTVDPSNHEGRSHRLRQKTAGCRRRRQQSVGQEGGSSSRGAADNSPKSDQQSCARIWAHVRKEK